MKYTVQQFREDFPDEDACLRYLLRNKTCPCDKRTFYRVKNRKCFACSCGNHIYPTAGTIFHKSSTPLTEWFYAIYLMSISKNGVAATELQRHLGVTYKTAWRMMHRIRTLMKQDTDLLSGIVEADEVYIGGRRRSSNKWTEKVPVLGVVERGGKIKTKHVVEANTGTIIGFLGENVQIGSRVMTDGLASYRKIPQMGLFHEFVEHKNKKEYVRGDVTTNTIEGFWGAT